MAGTLDTVDRFLERRATGHAPEEGPHAILDTVPDADPVEGGGLWRDKTAARSRQLVTAIEPIDVDDTAHAALVSMRRKREAGYRALGYRRQRDLELS